MGRRKGELTLLMEAAAKWPWKVSAALVPISYVGCHVVSTITNQHAAPSTVAQMGPLVISQGIHAFSNIFQFLLPMIFLITAIVSFVADSRAKALFSRTANGSQIDIAKLDWREFESLVGEGFRRRGFKVEMRGGSKPDGGVDLVLTKGSERSLVQCKQWRALQVTVSVVRELYGVMAAEQASAGYVVTSGTFTKDAKTFASGRNIELIDGEDLAKLLRDGRGTVAAVSVPVDPPGRDSKPPTCGQCGSKMVLRTAKRGSSAGDKFWGCEAYPKCRHTLST
jgi:restriction system protein